MAKLKVLVLLLLLTLASLVISLDPQKGRRLTTDEKWSSKKEKRLLSSPRPKGVLPQAPTVNVTPRLREYLIPQKPACLLLPLAAGPLVLVAFLESWLITVLEESRPAARINLVTIFLECRPVARIA